MEKTFSNKHDKALEAWVKLVVSFSSGSLILSVSLQKTGGHLNTQCVYLLLIGWAALAIALLSGLGYLFVSAHKWLQCLIFLRHIEECSTMARSTSAPEHLILPGYYAVWIYIMIFSFASGVVSLTWFSALNVLNR